jgi:hypothetical protein
VQLPAWQTTLPAVQVMFVQQAWAFAPQLPHEPLAQVPPMLGHAEPVPTQLPFTQQPPPPQVSAAQHGWPAPPQTSHSPAPLQTLPVSQLRPGQHAWPAAPHCVHRPLRHVEPAAVHELGPPPPQQAWPIAPQLAH